jgi:hypothetical protein
MPCKDLKAIHLLELPVEVLGSIIRLLSVAEIIKLASCSHALYAVCADELRIRKMIYDHSIYTDKKMIKKLSKTILMYENVFDTIVSLRPHFKMYYKHFVFPISKLNRLYICLSNSEKDGITANDPYLLALLIYYSEFDPFSEHNIKMLLKSPLICEALLKSERFDPRLENNFAIRVASEFNHISVVEKLLKSPDVDPSAMQSYALRLACANGHDIIVNTLLIDGRCDPTAENDSSIVLAVVKGHAKVVQHLLNDKRSNPTVKSHHLIRYTLINNYHEILWLLLKDGRIDPCLDNYLINMAAAQGNIQALRILLEDHRIDPTVQDNRPIRIAAQNNHYDIVALLLQDHRINLGMDLPTRLYQLGLSGIALGQNHPHFMFSPVWN